MSTSLQQIIKQLDADEPNYNALAAVGPDALPHLVTLVRGDDPGLASKAAYLASLIQSDDSIEVLSAAVASPNEAVRVAAAAGIKNVSSPQIIAVADKLLDDPDVGVRKVAARSAGVMGMEPLGLKLKAMAASDPDTSLRQIAKQQLKQRDERSIADRKPTAKSRATRATRRKTRGKRK